MGNFGGTPSRSPWFWRNPLANKLVGSSIGSAKLSLNQQSKTLAADFTTTNTTGFQTVLSSTILIPSGSSVAYFSFATFAVKHSAAGATADVALFLTDGSGTIQPAMVYGLYFATAAQIVPVSLNAGNSASDMSGLIRGQHLTFGLQVFNHTVGTLTISATGGNTPRISAFTCGDSSL